MTKKSKQTMRRNRREKNVVFGFVVIKSQAMSNASHRHF
jgi:hypothetical protein